MLWSYQLSQNRQKITQHCNDENLNDFIDFSMINRSNFIIQSNDFFFHMENRQLERELKTIIQGLRGDEILRIIDCFEKDHDLILNKNFAKSGINCTCCTLTYDKFTATGFGRNQQQALINAAKNYLETLIATNCFIPQLRSALKQRDIQIVPLAPQPIPDYSIVLSEQRGIADLSCIEEEEGCRCVYYEVHQHHLTEIRNLQARMKLVMKQNEMLKELLLKDTQTRSKEIKNNKENYSYKANYN